MAGILSPDGKWMWSGTQWIPAPPPPGPPAGGAPAPVGPPPLGPPAGGAAPGPGGNRAWRSPAAFGAALVAFLMGLFKVFSWLSSHSSPSNQALGRYQCIRGHVEHATHWTGPRKCSVCDQTMFWKG